MLIVTWAKTLPLRLYLEVAVIHMCCANGTWRTFFITGRDSFIDIMNDINDVTDAKSRRRQPSYVLSTKPTTTIWNLMNVAALIMAICLFIVCQSSMMAVNAAIVTDSLKIKAAQGTHVCRYQLLIFICHRINRK
jgi:uncharacterized membrane protein YgcG